MLHFAQQDKRIAPHPLPLSLERRGEFLSLAFKRRGTSAPDKPHPIVPRLQKKRDICASRQGAVSLAFIPTPKIRLSRLENDAFSTSQ